MSELLNFAVVILAICAGYSVVFLLILATSKLIETVATWLKLWP